MKRVLLALIPVAILASASLALSGLYDDEPFLTPSAPATDDAVMVSQAAPPPPASTSTEQKTTTEQAPAPKPESATQQQEPVVQAAPEEPEEPLPTLVVDKTQLTQAMTDIDEAIKQAKLAVTSLDANSQQRYMQETVNYLAGSSDPNFRLLAGTADSYKGARELLIQARVSREAAEVQWVAALQAQVEAKAKRLAELAQVGDGSTVTAPPASVDLNASLGPTGVLGTRGMRPEEQANELVARAIKHATEALRKAMNREQPQQSIADQSIPTNHASEQATETMESIVKWLETAKKIVQIAIDR